VLFRRSDVLVAGDIFVTTNYPVIDLANGGGVQGVIDGLNRLLDLAVPQHEQEGGTYVVPGHGRVADEADVLEYRDMVTIVRDRVQDMIDRRVTLDQIKAARPTLDYDLRYGSTSGPWTTGDVHRGDLQGPVDAKPAPIDQVDHGTTVRIPAHRPVTHNCLERRAVRSARHPRRPRARSPIRSHRLLGLGRQRGLAMADGHAGQG
jgi:hypothetical protein